MHILEITKTFSKYVEFDFAVNSIADWVLTCDYQRHADYDSASGFYDAPSGYTVTNSQGKILAEGFEEIARAIGLRVMLQLTEHCDDLAASDLALGGA